MYYLTHPKVLSRQGEQEIVARALHAVCMVVDGHACPAGTTISTERIGFRIIVHVGKTRYEVLWDAFGGRVINHQNEK